MAPPRHPLILCASLVENPMNLGALCRTAEVFRLEALVVGDAAVVDHRPFRKLAVSAQQWQPIITCPPAALPLWLSQHAAADYEIVALTAQAQATSLVGAALAQRTVLLLGRELTGIPPALLPCCHHVLHIPQYGRVNSLNVHTAAAIATYEYLRQWGHPVPPTQGQGPTRAD